MDFPPLPPVPPPRSGRLWLWTGTLVALALYGVFLARHAGAVAAGSDSSGYMNHARLLAEGRVHVPARTLADLPQKDAPRLLYVPLGFEPAERGEGLVPTYPAGFAVFVLAAEPIVGWRFAGDAVIVVHALAGIAATFALARLAGLRRRWSALCAAIVGLSPLYVFMSLQAMSDVPSLFWVTASIAAALGSRERAGWIIFSGAAAGVAVLLRPTNALLLVPLALALGASPRRWLILAAGGLPFALFFCAHSYAAYGSPVATGYGDMGLRFLARYVPASLANYVLWIPALLTPASLLFVGLPWVRGPTARVRWVLLAWFAVFAAFYAPYQCTHETWWYLRFLLPAVPALVVGAVLVLRRLFEAAPRWVDPDRSLPACAAAGLILLATALLWSRALAIPETIHDERRYDDVAQWMKRSLPADSICLCMQESGALFYYTPFTFLRWEALNPGNVSAVEAAVRRSGRPLYAVLFPFEVTEARVLERTMPGHWTPVEEIEGVRVFRRDFSLPP